VSESLNRSGWLRGTLGNIRSFNFCAEPWFRIVARFGNGRYRPSTKSSISWSSKRKAVSRSPKSSLLSDFGVSKSDFIRFCGKTVNESLKMRLTHYDRASHDQSFDDPQLAPYDRPEIAHVLLFPETPLIWFKSDESSAYHTARTTLLRSVVFAWPDCHSRAMVLGDELAIRGNPCSYAPDGQGAMVAQLQLGR
jgi:hypothetical protein